MKENVRDARNASTANNPLGRDDEDLQHAEKDRQGDVPVRFRSQASFLGVNTHLVVVHAPQDEIVRSLFCV